MATDVQTSMVVDCDTHFWQPVQLWEHFIDEPHRQAIVDYFTEYEAQREKSKIYNVMSVDASGKLYRDTGDDAADRLAHMDQEQIDVQIIFPGAGRGAMITDPILSGAACRAINRWNAEFAEAAPDRLMPSMVLPTRYPETAVAELQYAVGTLGLRSAFIAPTPSPERRWSDPDLDPLWEAMQAAGVVVCVHEFTQFSEGYQRVARPTYANSYSMMYYCDHTVEMQVTLMDLIVGGVLDRFPTLQFGFIEAHTAWLPGWLAHMDSLGSWLASHKRGSKGERHMSLLPTEFFRRQCFVVSFPDDAWIPEAVKYVGEDNVMIGTDYPHPGTSFQARECLTKAYPDLSPAVREKLLGGNAARIFGIGDRNAAA